MTKARSFKMVKKMELINIIGKETGLEEQEQDNGIRNRVFHIKENCNIPKRYLNAKLEPKTEEQTKLLKKYSEAFKGKRIDTMSDILITLMKMILLCSEQISV